MKTVATRESASLSRSARTMRSPVHSPRAAMHTREQQRIRLLVQPKLTIGQPDDQFEREADRVADSVVTNQPAPAISSVSGALSSAHSPGLQPKAREEDEQVQ